MFLTNIRSHARVLFNEAVTSVNPAKLVEANVKVVTSNGIDHLEINGKQYILKRNCYLVGFGKAVLSMARSIESILGPHLQTGIISVPLGTRTALFNSSNWVTPPYSQVQVLEGAKNNLPDRNSKEAAIRITNLVKELTSDSVLFVMISGGGSALLPLPLHSVTLPEKLDVIKLLGNAGADIVELNIVRKKLSQVKGGGLAQLAYPAQVISLIISDVVGDPLDVIASGPTYPCNDAANHAWEIIRKYNLESKLTVNVLNSLQTAMEIDKPSSFTHVNNVIIGNNKIALAAIQNKAQDLNYVPLVLSSTIQGNAKTLGLKYAELVTNICQYWASNCPCICTTTIPKLEMMKNEYDINVTSNDLAKAIKVSKISKKALCLILGGETTVQVSGNGIGGRNQELALSFSYNMYFQYEVHTELKDFQVTLLSAGTDGIDGPTDVAGAIGNPELYFEAEEKNINILSYLENNDSNTFFSLINNGNNFVKTGHTGTNVMDVHILIITDLEEG